MPTSFFRINDKADNGDNILLFNNLKNIKYKPGRKLPPQPEHACTGSIPLI